MSKKSYKADDIVGLLKQVDILLSQGKLISSAVRELGISDVAITNGVMNMVARKCVLRMQQRYGISQRRACKALCISRSVQRYQPRILDDETSLRSSIIRLASQYGVMVIDVSQHYFMPKDGVSIISVLSVYGEKKV